MRNYIKTFVLLAVTCVFTSIVSAQDVRPADAPPPEAKNPGMKPMQDRHVDFLHRLGLSEEQFQQVRKIHQERKPLMEEAQRRLREANRALNEAIYADQATEADVQARINDRQAAQAEVEKLRFMNEFAVRRLLTQEQLVRFRELRQQFEKLRETMETRRRNMGDRPFNKQRRRTDGNKPVQPTDQQRQDM